MMGNRCWTVLLLLVVAGCGQKSDNSSTGTTSTSPVAANAKSEAAPPAAATPQTSVALPQIAYSYDFTLELPAKAVLPLFERHRQACEAAGPDHCQIFQAETERVAATDTSATLTLRAESAWLAAFRTRLATDAVGADGAVTQSKTSSEDLGRTISDTSAKLRALTTLQGRLEALLSTRAGKLADLLETERELARVGGEIDATRSALADMRGRVTLPKATIVYQPDSIAVAGAGRGSGLGGELYDILTGSLFAMIKVVAGILPWLIVIVPLIWLVRRLIRRPRP